MSAWSHDDLAADLKAHLRGNERERLIWCDMQLGPSGSPRPDVYALPKSYSRFTPFAYEVKISRADYQSDINSGKWQKYYAYASAVVFAVPDGLIKTTELPAGPGLIVRKANVWRLVKAPKVNHLDNLPREAWLKLVMDGIGRLQERREGASEYLLRERAYKKALGADIARLVAQRDSAAWHVENEIKDHQKRLAAVRSQNESALEQAREKDRHAAAEFARLCDIFKLPHGAPTWSVTRAINEALAAVDADHRVQDLVRVIETAERALTAARLRVATPKEGVAA